MLHSNSFPPVCNPASYFQIPLYWWQDPLSRRPQTNSLWYWVLLICRFSYQDFRASFTVFLLLYFHWNNLECLNFWTRCHIIRLQGICLFCSWGVEIQSGHVYLQHCQAGSWQSLTGEPQSILLSFCTQILLLFYPNPDSHPPATPLPLLALTLHSQI